LAEIIDAWVHFIPPTPADRVTPEALSVFDSYGRADMLTRGTRGEDVIAGMDRAGISIAICAGDNGAVVDAVQRYGGRLRGQYHASPMHIMPAVREIRRHAHEYGFIGVRIEPFLYDRPPTHASYYPLYAACVEEGLALQTQVGHTGPLYPSETGRPLYIDRIALDFPDLRIVCGHIGWPWTEEMIAVAWKHRNVYIDTSAHVPKYYPERFVHFLKTFGKEKVLFASDFPLMPFERPLAELDSLKLPSDVRQLFLSTNARRAFALDGGAA
jgi:predicted TIM-barrel fold metal-dependent hydrolase